MDPRPSRLVPAGAHAATMAGIEASCGAACAEVARRQIMALAFLAEAGLPARWLLRTGPDAAVARESLSELTARGACRLSDDGDWVALTARQGSILRQDMDAQGADTARDEAARLLGSVHLDRIRDPEAWRTEVLDLVSQLQAVSTQDHSRQVLARDEAASALAQVARLAPSPVTLRLEEPIAVLATLLGPDHAHTLTARNSLAAAHRETGAPQRAVPLFEQVLTGALALLGPDHPLTLTARNNLAGAHRAAGEPGAAVPLYEQVIEDAERLLGTHHPDTLSARNNLALAHEAAGDLERAVDHLERLVEEARHELSGQHPYLAPFVRNLERVRSALDAGPADSR